MHDTQSKYRLLRNLYIDPQIKMRIEEDDDDSELLVMELRCVIP